MDENSFHFTIRVSSNRPYAQIQTFSDHLPFAKLDFWVHSNIRIRLPLRASALNLNETSAVRTFFCRISYQDLRLPKPIKIFLKFEYKYKLIYQLSLVSRARERELVVHSDKDKQLDRFMTSPETIV